MEFDYSRHRSKGRQQAGFALIASLSILAVLVLIGVALYSLSAVATKSADIASARTEAQANAKMALMLAIGDLQKYTGADTRITAPANILGNDETDLEIVDDNMPKLVGAWRSWEGLNHDATGRPIAEITGTTIYDLKQQPNDPTNPTDTGRFLSWLVSSATQGNNLNDPQTLAYLTETTVDGVVTVPLLTAGKSDDASDGSLRDADPGNNVPTPREIHVLPNLSDEGDRYAWWVSPENQKVRLAQPHAPRSDDAAALLEMGQSHTVPQLSDFGLDPEMNSLEPFNPNPTAAGLGTKAINRETLALMKASASDQPEKRFHDFSTSATGLLTNTATGGWRKDLSLLTEKWDDIYTLYSGGLLPLFRYAPISGATSAVPKPTTSDYDPIQCSLYPWSEYSTIIGEEQQQPNTRHAASASWQALQSFATAYKDFSYAGGEVTSPFVWGRISDQSSNLGGEQFYNFHHQQRLYSQIARFQFLIYARAFEEPKDDPDDPDEDPEYEVRLKYVPLFTLWNPYNITLELEISGTLNGGQNSGTEGNFRGFGWRRSAPGALAVTQQKGDGTYGVPDFKLLNRGNLQYLDSPGNIGIYDTALNPEYGGFWLDARTWACWLPEGSLTFGAGEAKIISPDFIDPGYGFGGTAMRLKVGYDPDNIVGPEFLIKNNAPRDRRYRFLFRPDRLTKPYQGRAPGAGFSLSFGDGGSHFGGSGSPLPPSVHPSGIGDEFHNITALSNESEADDYWPPDEVDEIDMSVGELVDRWTPLFSVSFGPRMTIGTGLGSKQDRPTKGVVQNDALAAMVLSDPASGEAKDHPANNTFDFAYHSLAANSNATPEESLSGEAYIGTGNQKGNGLSRLIMIEMPLRPMASLIELQGWNPRGNNPYPPFQMNLIGNSDATPLIPENSVVPSKLSPNSIEHNLMHDDAYCANHLLFDDWFVSSIAPEPVEFGGSINRDIEAVYADFLQGNARLNNRTYRPIPEDRGLSATEVSSLADDIINSSDGDGWLKVASRLEVEGMFNVNSTSVAAWEALLGHAKSREEIALYGESDIVSITPIGDHPVTRGAAAFDEEAGSGSVIGADSDFFPEASEYLGFRSLDDSQIRDLAERIVEQVRERGPFLSLAEFINRKLTDDPSEQDLALAGAVQTALNNLSNDPMATLKDPNINLSSKTLSDPLTEVSDASKKLSGSDYEFPEAAEGDSAFGAPGWVRQADILRPIAPVLSARDDTFTIRAYGDKLDQQGNIIAQAWCEAVVKRTRNFCDASDPADSIEPPTSPTNLAFGRKYEIVSFRWLAPEEV